MELKKKKCGIDKITLVNTETFKTSLAAEIKDYNPLDYFEPKASKKIR